MDVRHATEAVGLYEHILNLHDGFDTKLNASGAPLSGSQRELLCLARAIAARPRLLLIDGLFDLLSDEELETAISYVLDPEREWTVILTTGRQSIAERCKTVMDVRKGPSGTSLMLNN